MQESRLFSSVPGMLSGTPRFPVADTYRAPDGLPCSVHGGPLRPQLTIGAANVWCRTRTSLRSYGKRKKQSQGTIQTHLPLTHTPRLLLDLAIGDIKPVLLGNIQWFPRATSIAK